MSSPHLMGDLLLRSFLFQVMMKLQLPEGLEDEMQVMLLDKLLGAKFFEILRTQQLGAELFCLGSTSPLASRNCPTCWNGPTKSWKHQRIFSCVLYLGLLISTAKYRWTKLLSFFSPMVGRQQLGYIVQLAATVPMKFPQLVALAQTEFPPDYVRGRRLRLSWLVEGCWNMLEQHFF